MDTSKQFKKTKYLNRLEMLKDAKYTIFWLVYFLVLTLALSSFVYNVLAYTNSCVVYVIQNSSMYPTINQNSLVNDKTIVDTTLKPEVGKIIMYVTLINSEVTNITKRIVATEGDKITVVKETIDGQTSFYLQRIPNGHTSPYKIQEDYVADKSSIKTTYEKFEKLYQRSDIQTELINGQMYIVVPENNIFFLGDNRASSYDSSNMGPCSIDGYRGTATYLIKEGKNLQLIQMLYALGLLAPNI